MTHSLLVKFSMDINVNLDCKHCLIALCTFKIGGTELSSATMYSDVSNYERTSTSTTPNELKNGLCLYSMWGGGVFFHLMPIISCCITDHSKI